MVSITLSVPEEIRKLMKQHDEINWSGFVRKSIEEKIRQIAKIEAFKQRIRKDDKEAVDWSVKLQRASREGRIAALKKKGLI